MSQSNIIEGAELAQSMQGLVFMQNLMGPDANVIGGMQADMNLQGPAPVAPAPVAPSFKMDF